MGLQFFVTRVILIWRQATKRYKSGVESLFFMGLPIYNFVKIKWDCCYSEFHARGRSSDNWEKFRFDYIQLYIVYYIGGHRIGYAKFILVVAFRKYLSFLLRCYFSAFIMHNISPGKDYTSLSATIYSGFQQFQPMQDDNVISPFHERDAIHSI